MPKLSHYGKTGEAHMVDVSAKQVTTRTAVAQALVKMPPRVVRAIRRLKARARAAHIPAVYVNDNFGRWRSDFRKPANILRRRFRREAFPSATSALLSFLCCGFMTAGPT